MLSTIDVAAVHAAAAPDKPPLPPRPMPASPTSLFTRGPSLETRGSLEASVHGGMEGEPPGGQATSEGPLLRRRLPEGPAPPGWAAHAQGPPPLPNRHPAAKPSNRSGRPGPLRAPPPPPPSRQTDVG
jgi:hypothetical protein